MSEAEIAQRIVAALTGAAREAVGAPAPLISVEITWIAAAPSARIETRIGRKARTLLFMSADVHAADGARIASASSVHKLD